MFQCLFTNVPLKETLDIAVNLIHTNNTNFSIDKTDLKKLFLFATCETHFLFNGCYYDQVDGLAMGSPLAPVLAVLSADICSFILVDIWCIVSPM